MRRRTEIVVVDYGCGNLFSIQRALSKIGASSRVSRSAEEIRDADKIILPGVGAFGDGMDSLRSCGLIDVLLECASSGTPILGICLGMQLLMTESIEFGHHKGLNLIPGTVTRLSDHSSEHGLVKVPHIGWSPIHLSDDRQCTQDLFCGIDDGEYMYFLHSFFVTPETDRHCSAATVYGSNHFCCVVARDNIVGVQFHPELSAESGLRLLHNFAVGHDVSIDSETAAAAYAPLQEAVALHGEAL